MTVSPTFERDRVRKIAEAAMRAVVENYRAGPSSRDRVFEALNALAFATATVLAGTGDRAARRGARDFFDRALAKNITEIMVHPPEPLH